MRFQPLFKELRRGFALVAVCIEEMHLSRIVLPCRTESLLAQEAHRKLRQRAKVQHRFSRKLTQFRTEHFSIVLIGAHHAGEVLSI